MTGGREIRVYSITNYKLKLKNVSAFFKFRRTCNMK